MLNRLKTGGSYKVLLLCIMILALWPAALFAQDEARQGQDPTGTNTICPLDTWMWVWVLGAMVLGAVNFYRERITQDSV